MKIAFEIADDREFLLGFLKENPIPEPRKGEVKMTEEEWIRAWVIEQLQGQYGAGKKLLAYEAVRPETTKGLVK